MTDLPTWAAEMQRQYRSKRLKWARSIGRPVTKRTLSKPEPGTVELDVEDEG